PGLGAGARLDRVGLAAPARTIAAHDAAGTACERQGAGQREGREPEETPLSLALHRDLQSETRKHVSFDAPPTQLNTLWRKQEVASLHCRYPPLVVAFDPSNLASGTQQQLPDERD